MSLIDAELDTPSAPADPRLARRKALTLALMVAGYTGFYFCRSNFAVSTPLIIEDLASQGLNANDAKKALGWVVTLGTLAYAIGKLPGGGLVDFLGGRRVYLTGMASAVGFTILFALGGSIPMFTLAWMGNRLLQSSGWPGMVKIVSRWFPASSYGMAMGILSLSFNWGDAAGRSGMGLLFDHGFGWRSVYFIAAALLFGLLVLNFLFLRESPGELGLKEPPTNPLNVFGKEGSNPTPSRLSELLIPLFRSPVFWMVCLLSFGLTLLRETFNAWSSTYFTESVGMSPGLAAKSSASFPLLGGFSVLLAGFLGDRVRKGGRAAIIGVGMVLTALALVVLARIDPKASIELPIALVGLIGFLLIGPYSYIAGAVSLDLGGKRGGATTCGIMDFVGYLGGAFAGRAMAGISVRYGWQGAFELLAIVAGVSAIAAGVLVVIQQSRFRPVSSDDRS